MNRFPNVTSMHQAASAWKAEGKRIALIPTSGSIHPGHQSLIREARLHADVVVVSLFANPLQFAANENFANYPKTGDADIAACEAAGADAVFTPAVEEIYPKGYSTYVSEDAVAKPLCGVSRPNHFRGVITVMVKLINIMQPNLIVLGQKDAQQVSVIRKMLTDLNFNVDLRVAPITRDADGLACNVRNRELTTLQRQETTAIHRALLRAKEMVDSGVRSVDRVIAEVTHILRQQRRVRVIYIAIVDPDTMEPLREIAPGSSLLTMAAWIDEIRLTDNIQL